MTFPKDSISEANLSSSSFPDFDSSENIISKATALAPAFFSLDKSSPCVALGRGQVPILSIHWSVISTRIISLLLGSSPRCLNL